MSTAAIENHTTNQQPTSRYLGDEQLARVAALTEARGVVLGHEQVSAGWKAVEGWAEPGELCAIAEYILTGKQPEPAPDAKEDA